MQKFALAAFAALAVSSPAYAQNFHVEVQGGYEANKADGVGGSIDGVSYGGTLAVELPLDESIFIGAEVRVSDSTADECVGARTAADPQICADYGRDFTAGGRIGVDLTKNSSLYATVGYTNVRVGTSLDDGTTAGRIAANLEGIKLGVGFRQYVGKRLYGKLEYHYSDLEAGLKRHQGQVGIGYQF